MQGVYSNLHTEVTGMSWKSWNNAQSYNFRKFGTWRISTVQKKKKKGKMEASEPKKNVTRSTEEFAA